MDQFDQQPQKKSYKMLWIAGASVVVFLAILGGTFYLVSQSAKNNKQASTSPSPSASKKVATKAELKSNLDKLATQMKKASSDQTALAAALKTPPKKVGQ